MICNYMLQLVVKKKKKKKKRCFHPIITMMYYCHNAMCSLLYQKSCTLKLHNDCLVSLPVCELLQLVAHHCTCHFVLDLGLSFLRLFHATDC